MIKKTKHATTNYRALKPFIDATEQAGGHKRFKSAGYMDLVIEDLYFTDHEGNEVFSISHYGEQNGDLMADPEMEFSFNEKEGRIMPRTFRNDYIGLYQEVFKTIKGRLMYSERLLIDLDAFMWQWLTNIEAQGFKAV